MHEPLRVQSQIRTGHGDDGARRRSRRHRRALVVQRLDRGTAASSRHHPQLCRRAVCCRRCARLRVAVAPLPPKAAHRIVPDGALGLSLLLRAAGSPQPSAARLRHRVRHPINGAVQLSLVLVGHHVHRRAADAAGTHRGAGDSGTAGAGEQRGRRAQQASSRTRCGHRRSRVCPAALWIS